MKRSTAMEESNPNTVGVAENVGPKGEGGLDDATGAGGTGASNMKQTSAVVNLGKDLVNFSVKHMPGTLLFTGLDTKLSSVVTWGLYGGCRGSDQRGSWRFLWDGF